MLRGHKQTARGTQSTKLSSSIVAAMQELAVEQRRSLGARAPWHVGDIAWGLRQHEGRESEWPIRLWVEDGRVVAWSWLKQDGRDRLEHDIDAGYLHLLDTVLDEPRARVAFAFEDDSQRRDALAKRGFTEPGVPMHYLTLDVADAPEVPPLPVGFRYRTVADGDLAERVAIHREVWTRPGAASRSTESSYQQVRMQWPYRDALDCVIEASDGRFVAYCLCWLDEENSVGEFEPVGVREDFRRRGFGAAVCAFALRQLSQEGGREAIVYCVTEPARALYESVGFRVHASLVGYSK